MHYSEQREEEYKKPWLMLGDCLRANERDRKRISRYDFDRSTIWHNSL